MRGFPTGLLIVVVIALQVVNLWRQSSMEKRMSERINAKIDEVTGKVTDLLQTAVDEIEEVKSLVQSAADEDEVVAKLDALSTKLDEAKAEVESISDAAASGPDAGNTDSEPTESETTP